MPVLRREKRIPSLQQSVCVKPIKMLPLVLGDTEPQRQLPWKPISPALPAEPETAE